MQDLGHDLRLGTCTCFSMNMGDWCVWEEKKMKGEIFWERERRVGETTVGGRFEREKYFGEKNKE